MLVIVTIAICILLFSGIGYAEWRMDTLFKDQTNQWEDRNRTNDKN